MNHLKHLIEQRVQKEDEMKRIMTTCQDEKRSRTEAERLKWQSLKKEVDNLYTEIKDLELQEAIDQRTAKPVKQGDENHHSENEEDETEKRFLDFQIKEKVPVNRKMPATDYVLRNYDIDQRMQKVNVYSVIAGLCGRQFPAGSATDYALQTEKRSLTSSALLNPFLSAQLLDGGLAKARVIQAGAKTFVMSEDTTKWVRVATYPTLEWKAQLASTTERTAAFENVTFEAKTLRGFITIAGEVLRGSTMNVEQALKQVFSKSIANGVDTAALVGAGGDAPTGIENYSDVNVVSWNDNIDDFDAWVAAQQAIYEEDGNDINASIMSPDAWSQIARLKGTSEFQPIQPPFFLKDHKFLQTSKLSDPGQPTTIFTGAWESLNIGVRLNAEIILTPVSASTYGYDMLAVFRGDIKPDREEDFAIIEGVQAAPALT